MLCRRLIALIIVSAYLFLPLQTFASLSPCHNGASVIEIASSQHCDLQHPCSGDQHGSHDCNSTCSCCSCCSFFAPPLTEITVTRTATSFWGDEPLQRFPEVYIPIFVPPQNRA